MSTPNPYEKNTSTEVAFIGAVKALSLFHYKKSGFYKKLIDRAGYDLNKIVTIQDLEALPVITTDFIKQYSDSPELLSIPKEEIYLNLTSSGTTGQKSQIFFDKRSIEWPQEILDEIFQHYGWISENPAQYLLFTYETEPQSKLGTAYTDNYLCKYAPVHSSFSALRMKGDGGHEFDSFGTIDTLHRYEKEGMPVRIFGFPSFMWFTLKRMKALGLKPLKLHKDSFCFFGGGWKGHASEEISKRELYEAIHEMLGIPRERIRDGYGSVEHCIPYVECENHNFHIPTWSHVVIRNLKNLEPVGYREKGFLSFISPYITSMPFHSVMSSDLASVHRHEECGCGTKTDFFVVYGRAGTSQSKSCAVSASELLV